MVAIFHGAGLLEKAVDNLHLILVQLLPRDFCLKIPKISLAFQYGYESRDFASLFMSRQAHQVMNRSWICISQPHLLVFLLNPHFLCPKCNEHMAIVPPSPCYWKSCQTPHGNQCTPWEKLNQSLHHSL